MTSGAVSRRDALALAVLAALAAVLFRGTLAALYGRWTDWEDGTYSHGLLVPVFSLYILWEKRDKLRGIEMSGSLWGAAVMGGAVLAFLAGRAANIFFLQALALIATLAGMALLVGGWRFFKVTALPIAFLIFMCPLPSGLYDLISAKLRLLASATSTAALQMGGVVALREGNLITLPSRVLSVEDACSGIRSLFGIVATATAFALLAPGGALRKSVFVLSAAPIAVASNILRVTGTGLLHYYGSARLADGFYHYLEGWGFYVLALAMLFAEYFVLSIVFPAEPEEDGGAKKDGGAAL